MAKSSKNNRESKKKVSGTRFIICLVIFALLCGGFFVSLPYQDGIDDALGLRKVETYQAGDLVSVGAMNIHFIDVGQGDACLIELPDDKTVLIDAGDRNNKVKEKLTDYIDNVNAARTAAGRALIAHFDYVIATHSDSDHIGSMAYILGLYPAAVFYRPNQQATCEGFTDPATNPALPQKNRFWGDKHGEKDTITYKEALDAGYAPHDKFVEAIVTNPHDDTQNIIKPELAAGHNLYYELNFYGPVKSYYSDHNDYSPIIIAEYKGRRIALSGDCESKGEKDFVSEVESAAAGSRYSVFDSTAFYADIIKLGHHGSQTSSSQKYLEILTKPDTEIYVVISVDTEDAAKKHWVHPHPDVLARIKNLGIPDENILKTDDNGDIFFALNHYDKIASAVVERDRAGECIIITYPVELFGVAITYKVAGIAVLVVLAIIFILLNFAHLSNLSKKNKRFKKGR